MPNDLKTWRAIACRRVPMVAAILHACSYQEADVPTFQVNPHTLQVEYSQKFADKQTAEQNAFVLAHEGAHVLCRHGKRRQEMMRREGKMAFRMALWVEAEEQAVNALVSSVGNWEVPSGGVQCPDKHQKLTTEEIYYKLKQEGGKGSKCQCVVIGEGEGWDDKADSVTELLCEQAIKTGERVAMKDGKNAGNMAGELRAMHVASLPLDRPPDFRTMLLRYLTNYTASCNTFDDSTIYRNRVLLDGLCVPNLASKPSAARFAASIDNSGSVADEMFGQFKGALVAAAEQLGFTEVVVQHFTTQVMKTERYSDLNRLAKFKRQANGGTALEDCDMKARQEKAVFNIILTDGYVQWLPAYSVPTVIVRVNNGTEPPPRVHNLIGDVVLA